MKGIKRVEYDNGLTLLMEKRGYNKKAAILVATKTGSIEEPAQLSGITHFIEHMLFMENKWKTAQEIKEELESMGAEINAFTDQLFMTFYAKTLSYEVVKTLQIIFEATINDTCIKEEFLNEKNNILSENKLAIEHPLIHLYGNVFFPLLFKGTPLEKTIDGNAKTIKGITVKKLIDYKKQILVPKRPMIIVVVGRYNEEELIEQIGKTFGSLPPGKPGPGIVMCPKNKKTKMVEKREEIEQAYLAMGYQIPGIYHKDTLKLGLIQSMLTQGLSSRLFRELRDKRGIGYVSTSELESFGSVGSFVFLVTINDPSRVEEVENIITTEIHDLRKNLVSNKELEKAKNIFLSHYYESLDLIEDRAMRIMVNEFQNVPYDFRKIEYYIRRLSARSIKEAAQKYLTDDYALAVLMPKNA